MISIIIITITTTSTTIAAVDANKQGQRAPISSLAQGAMGGGICNRMQNTDQEGHPEMGEHLENDKYAIWLHENLEAEKAGKEGKTNTYRMGKLACDTLQKTGADIIGHIRLASVQRTTQNIRGMSIMQRMRKKHAGRTGRARRWAHIT